MSPNESDTTLAEREAQAQRPSQQSQPKVTAMSRGSMQGAVGAAEQEKDRGTESKDVDGPGEDFEVKWDGDHDPMNPRSMGTARKWMIVLIVSTTSLCVTCTSSLYTSTYDQITKEFHCSEIVATLGLSLFVIGLGIGPMVIAPLSEFYGRRPIYIVSLIFFIIWIIPCAAAMNIQTMLIGRFFDGVAGSAFLSVAGGTVGDMFSRNSLQAPMMIFTASPFLGPEVGPIMGGFINQYTSWRWSFYVILIWSGVMLAFVALLVPETYHPVLLRNKARGIRKETGDERWKAPIEGTDRSIAHTIIRSIYRPFLLLSLDPMCLNLCLFSAILLGVLYLFFGAFNIVFMNNYGFQMWQVGLSFLGIFIGMMIGIATDPWWHRNYLRLVTQREKKGGEPGGAEPEYRLPPAIGGAILVPIGLFWFGWTNYATIHWIVPIIGSAVFGTGSVLYQAWITVVADQAVNRILLVFSGIFTFLVDAYPLYAASALAANSFARSSFAAAFPLFGVQMYDKLGYQWATSLLALLTVAMAPFPYIFFRYGKRIRGRSRFASAN